MNTLQKKLFLPSHSSITRSIFLLILCLFLLPSCDTLKKASQTTSPTAMGKRDFKAVLFPYIPDAAGDNFKSLKGWLKYNFERKHPDINLTIVMDPNMNVYDPETINQLMGTGTESANIVELDAILLDYLVDNGLSRPLQNIREYPDIAPSAWSAVSANKTYYGMPTYLCSNVIYSYDQNILRARNGRELVEVLTAVNPRATPLVGNYAGSWTLPSCYVDAYGDTYGNSSETLLKSYNPPLDPRTMTVFSKVVDACENKATKAIPCLDGTYKDNTGAETAFASRAANGFFGYTERLFYILKANARLPSVISAPIGGGSNPVMFVDALFTNSNCQGQCAQDAEAFSKYMNELQTRNLIAFSYDAPIEGRTPRYLLQANTAFYNSHPSNKDKIYQALARSVVSQAKHLPSDGFMVKRKALNALLKEALEKHQYDLSKKVLHELALSRFPERF